MFVEVAIVVANIVLLLTVVMVVMVVLLLILLDVTMLPQATTRCKMHSGIRVLKMPSRATYVEYGTHFTACTGKSTYVD